MVKKFKKIMAVVGSMFMVGSTVGLAMAAGGAFPVPFVKDNSADYALVYGANSAASDLVGVNALDTYLNTFYSSDSTSNTSTSTTTTETVTTSDFSSAVSVTYDDIELGDGIGTKTLTDSKITSLIDNEINWDDSTGYKNYDVHEEILLKSGLKVVTTLDTEDLNTSVALENDQALEYRYIFDDALDKTKVGHVDSSDLTVNILGKEYELLDMETNSVVVSEAEEKIVTVGSKIVIDGITLTVNDIFSNLIEINGVLIDLDEKKVVNGIEVEVESIAYHTTSTLPSKAIVSFGRDIERTIDDGDEYIEDDETWKWVVKDLGLAGGYIGVKYDQQNIGFDEDEAEENPIPVGQSYIFPENYAAVSFDELTNVDYDDFKIYFDDRDFYNVTHKTGNNVDVAILEGENEDSIKLQYGVLEVETSTIYFDYDSNNITMYFKDIDGDADSDNEGRIQITNSDTAKLIVDDTTIDVSLSGTTLILRSLVEDIEIKLGHDGTNFDKLGSTKDDAETDEIYVGKNIGTREDDVMDHYGIVIKDPENNADNDRVLLEIPSEQVYAEVSVKGQGSVITTTETNEVETNETSNETVIDVPEVIELGGIIVKDTEINSVKDRNLIIVGGSCINAEAARLLEGKACGSDFTLKTGVTAGKALIQTFASPHNSNKVAVVVAGYNAADTTKAVNQIINTALNIDLGQKYIV